MKKIAIFFLLVTITFGCEVQMVNAQTTNVGAIEAITSKRALKTYALEKPVQAHMWVWTTYGETRMAQEYIVRGGTVGEMLAEINNITITAETLRPEEEKVNIYVSLEDDRWNDYFYGGVWGTPLTPTTNGGWIFQTPELKLRLADYILVDIPGANGRNPSNVEITIRDEIGDAIETPYTWVDSGQFAWLTDRSGMFGEVKISFGWLQTIYDIQSGQTLSPTNFYVERVVAGIDNYKEVTLPGGYQYLEWSFNRYDQNRRPSTPPVYRAKITGTTTVYIYSNMYEMLNGQKTNFEFPTRIWIKEVGSQDPAYPVSPYGWFTLPSGEYWISFEYQTLEAPENPPQPEKG